MKTNNHQWLLPNLREIRKPNPGVSPKLKNLVSDLRNLLLWTTKRTEVDTSEAIANLILKYDER